jgi:hypothetical protein
MPALFGLMGAAEVIRYLTHNKRDLVENEAANKA